jgi:hypothetical protein
LNKNKSISLQDFSMDDHGHSGDFNNVKGKQVRTENVD